MKLNPVDFPSFVQILGLTWLLTAWRIGM